MRTKLRNRIIALILAITTIMSLFTISATSSSAQTTLDKVQEQGYMSMSDYTVLNLQFASKAFLILSQFTGNPTVKGVASFIDSTVISFDNQGPTQLDMLENTCNEILKQTSNTYSVVEDISRDMSKNTINTSKEKCDKAFEEQTLAYTTKHDEATYDFYNAYIAYIKYLKYACSNADIDESRLESLETAYLEELRDYYASMSNDYYNGAKNVDEYYNEKMYTTNAMDICFSGFIKTMLNNMDPDSSTISKGRRFIDLAAQYAFYAFPFSGEQADFVDKAAEQQINSITTLLMMYQDFVAHRAEYLERLMIDSETDTEYNELWSQLSSKYFDKTFVTFADTIENFINSDLYIADFDASVKLSEYIRNESVTVDKNGYTLSNSKHQKETKYNANNYTSVAKNTAKEMIFYKNASVKIENGRLIFKPFYVFNGDIKDANQMLLTSFDIVEDHVGNILGGLFKAHYLRADYFNHANGLFTDGLNNFSPATDPSQIKDLVNEHFYINNCSSAYDYFAEYLGYAKNNPLYMLLNQKTKFIGAGKEQNRYTEYSVFNMKNKNNISTSWNAETMSYEVLDDNNIKNAMFCTILIPNGNEFKSKLTTEIIGNGEITTEGVTDGVAKSGSSSKVTVTAPEKHFIQYIKVQYKVAGDKTEEKVLYDGIDSNNFTFNYSVPYTESKIIVETAPSIPTLNQDRYGNYLISSSYDMLNMMDMINNGNSKYQKGSYILTNDIETGYTWETPIGTPEHPFEGTFDGRGHSISKLSFDPYSTDENFGIFGNVTGGNIKNLTVNNYTLSSSKKHTSLGTICGYCKDSYIENCNITGYLTANSDLIGGIVGTAENSNIKNCSTALHFTIEHNNSLSDICGNNINTEIIDCVSNNTSFTMPDLTNP